MNGTANGQITFLLEENYMMDFYGRFMTKRNINLQ